MAADPLTIQLPDDLYHRLERFAERTNQPMERLIVRAVAFSLPTLPEQLSPEVRDALQALEDQSDEDLWHVVQATLPDEQYQRVSELRACRLEQTLTPAEQTELDRLLEAADLLTLEKGYAATLLRWRGYRLPPAQAPSDSN